MNKNKFKKLFYKFSCCLVCVLVLMQPLTAFAIKPTTPTTMYDGDVYSQTFIPEDHVYNFKPSYFTVASGDDIGGNGDILLYERILKLYNWNYSDANLNTFDLQYMSAYSPLDTLLLSTDGIINFNVVMLAFKHLSILCGLYDYNSTSKQHIDWMSSVNSSFFIYANPETKSTEFVMVNNYYQDLSGYIVSENYSLSKVDISNTGKHVYGFGFNGGQIHNHVYRISIPQYPTESNIKYTISRIDSANCWISEYNLIYASDTTLCPFSISSTVTPNYYFYNNLNKGCYAHFADSVIYLESSLGGSSTVRRLFNYTRADYSMQSNYILPFKFYFMGNSNNFDYVNFFSMMKFINFGSNNSLPAISASTATYHFISSSTYIDPVTGNTLTCVNMNLSFYNTEASWKGQGHYFIVDYYTSLEWSTCLLNNFTDISGPLDQNDMTAESAWSSLNNTLNLLNQIVTNLYLVLPGEVYSVLVVSVTLIIALGTIRVVTG